MTKRKIIKINEKKCTGCGLCIPNCKEGALQIVDGKARLISDLFCDGLGACIGHCPEGAIKIEEREAEPYDEKKTMLQNIIPAGTNTIRAHLEHLRDHNQKDLLKQALKVLKEKGLDNPLEDKMEHKHFEGCPGSRMMDFQEAVEVTPEEGKRVSKLRQWPVQLYLVPGTAPFFQGRDVVLAADCVAYSLADFHKDHLDGKSLAIACPKLDSEQEVYIDKITSMIDDAKVNTITVMTMEVPCCQGLVRIANQARDSAKRKVPIKHITVGIQGDVKTEVWL
jgi:ferredoxin